MSAYPTSSSSAVTGLLVTASLAHAGLTVRSIAVGSLGGLAAAKRGECDLAPIHLLDEKTETYNTPFLSAGLDLVTGLAPHAGDRLQERGPAF